MAVLGHPDHLLLTDETIHRPDTQLDAVDLANPNRTAWTVAVAVPQRSQQRPAIVSVAPDLMTEGVAEFGPAAVNQFPAGRSINLVPADARFEGRKPNVEGRTYVLEGRLEIVWYELVRFSREVVHR